MPDFLFEIGVEEVPARMLAAAEAELKQRVVSLLERERLASVPLEAQIFSTPRRLAVLVTGVADRQLDLSEEVMGPAVKIAYKDGQPGPAALAFAKKSGVPFEDLKIIPTPKGDYLSAVLVKAGQPASTVLAEHLPKELASLYWAKNMYWRTSKPERFVRPVRWLLALLGDEVVPVSFGGYTAARLTYGHRVLFGSAPISVQSPKTYTDQLRSAFVIADVELRRHTIRKALDQVCRTLPGTRWREDHALVDKMTHMTEWPSVLAGSFDPEFLALPEEVLVTVMRDHQNYFAVEDTSGKLAPHFLAVLNTVATEAGQAVIRHGNARVLRARFNDARFFWQFDQRISLEDRVPLLENVTFQKDLGSYALKSTRIAELSARFAALLHTIGIALDAAALATAARLAKTDLTTELVKEFTELQGQVGGLYATAQGLGATVADAIYDHYRPASMDDRIPRTLEAQVLALADKADTIAAMFSLGMEPTGSKDPFALRRAANGIVRILAEGSLPLTLSQVVTATAALPETATNINRFFAERLDFYLRETRGHAYDVVKAVLAAGSDDVRDTVARAEAVTAVRGSHDFAAISSAFKRMQNIVSQAAEKGYAVAEPEVLHFTQPYEAEFWAQAKHAGLAFDALCEDENYQLALAKLASLRAPIDNYFDQTMVMTDDEVLRSNRLGMLHFLIRTFSRIADFSEIVVGA